MSTKETTSGATPGNVPGSARGADATPRNARRTLLALSLLGAIALGAPQAASAFPGFYVPGPRFYAPPIYVPAPPPVYVPAPPVYYVPVPRIRYYAPYRAHRPRFHP